MWELSFQQPEQAEPQRKKDATHFQTLSAFLGPAIVNESMFRSHWEFSDPQPGWMNALTSVGGLAQSLKSSHALQPHLVSSATSFGCEVLERC
jgi:hypothetical protein